MSDNTHAPYYALFLEAGIINQIGTAFLEARLPKGLLVSHFGVVSHLIRVRDAATPLELANAFQVAKTTMTHTLSGLKKHGYIEFQPNPDDGRSKQVRLTDAGRQFHDRAIKKMAPVFEELARRYSPEQVNALLPQLSNFRVVVDHMRDEIG